MSGQSQERGYYYWSKLQSDKLLKGRWKEGQQSPQAIFSENDGNEQKLRMNSVMVEVMAVVWSTDSYDC